MKTEVEIDERIEHLNVWIKECDQIIKHYKNDKEVVNALENRKRIFKREIKILEWVKN